jgi:hypothetical protein
LIMYTKHSTCKNNFSPVAVSLLDKPVVLISKRNRLTREIIDKFNDSGTDAKLLIFI